MARAKRHYIPGMVWHITDRCHKKEYLLRFARDKKRWLHWLFQAKQRFGLSVLGYTLTSNHIHLLVIDEGKKYAIPKSMQLVQGRTAQEYNQRKGRNGAFWGDRYGATAVETGEHFLNCLLYIDLNMVRAGVVCHPREWPYCGYSEIIRQKQRYQIVQTQTLLQLLGISSQDEFIDVHTRLIEDTISKNDLKRDPKWTESLAVGSKEFVESFQDKLSSRSRRAEIVELGNSHILREAGKPYNATFPKKNENLR
jgi:putative transposase